LKIVLENKKNQILKKEPIHVLIEDITVNFLNKFVIAYKKNSDKNF